MRKIQLDVDTLNVESFETRAAEPARGTVQGHWSRIGTCDAAVGTCAYGATCGAGCATKSGCTQLDCV